MTWFEYITKSEVVVLSWYALRFYRREFQSLLFFLAEPRKIMPAPDLYDQGRASLRSRRPDREALR